jgi:hypothetical protein
MTSPTPPSTHHSGKKYWLDQPANVNKLILALVVICALLVLADLFYHKHVHFAFETWFGFHAWFGFGMCVALVLIAKELRKIIKREENYYD